MKILIVYPVACSMYISDFWRCSLTYETANYLQNQNYQIDIFDGGLHNCNHALYEKIIMNKYDCILLNAPLDSMDGFYKTLKYIRMLDPFIPIYTYGLSTLLCPEFFKGLDIQGFSTSGFFEIGIQCFLDYVENGEVKDFKNCEIKKEGKWLSFPKVLGNSDDWGFMDVKQVNNFKVIRVTISRGCFGNCNFCSCAILHGGRDIRKSVDEVVSYLKELENVNFKGVVEFASPTFTANKIWVKELCEKIREQNINIKWRAVTRVDCLDENIIKEMSKSGCTRIGLGIETINDNEQNNINKNIEKQNIANIITTLKNNNIEPLAYLISGIEEQTFESFINTYNYVKELGASPRVTALLRYNSLKFDDMIKLSIDSDMTTSSLSKLTKDQRYKLMSLIMNTADLDDKYDK